MALGQQTNGDVVFIDSGSYPALDFRRLIADQPVGPGVADYNSFKATLSAGMTLNIGAGAAYVRQPGDGTLYRVTQEGAALQITLDVNASSNPRVDQVILHIYDGSAQGDTSGQYFASVEVINGAATAGATLDNRAGAPDPQSALTTGKAYIPLADVLIAGSASTISAGNIRNRRPVAVQGLVPALNGDQAVSGDTFQVQPRFAAGLGIGRAKVTGDNMSSFSSAALFFNPTQIPATKIRWRYLQGGISGDGITAVNAGFNWRYVICDASGRMLADTGSVAFSGSAGAAINVNSTLSVPYSGYVFDVGAYYAWFAIGGVTAGQGFYVTGVQSGGVSGGDVAAGYLPPSANQLMYLNSGGVTFPADNTIRTLHDMNGSTGAATYHLPVPLFTLAT